jgi:hypothetical protein
MGVDEPEHATEPTPRLPLVCLLGLVASKKKVESQTERVTSSWIIISAILVFLRQICGGAKIL